MRLKMNRDTVNKYFQAFFADEESISSDVCIRWQNQCLYLDENMYKNPISLAGDNSETDVASSENLAALVNQCPNGVNLEEAYSLIIHNMILKPCSVNALSLGAPRLYVSGPDISGLSISERREVRYDRLVNIAKEKIQNEL